MEREPKTLVDAVRYFADTDRCHKFLLARIYPNGVVCPTCGAKDVRYIETRRLWECKAKHAKRQFSIKAGTIFEESPIPLDKWLTCVWMIANCKNGISSYEIHRALGVTQKSAWFMLHRVRLALRVGSFEKMGGEDTEIEVDETFVGPRAKNMHADKRERYAEAYGSDSGKIAGAAASGKTIVMGFLDRSQRKIRTQIVPDTSRLSLQTALLNNVHLGTNVYTDEAGAYRKLPPQYIHQFVNHAEKYVNGRVHTNGLENFWSLFKRHLNGTYVAVEPFHLFRYLDEQVFRYNNRGTQDEPMSDYDRFDLALRSVVGKRITYKELTGKEGETKVV